jgi:hypothetical protein
MVIRKSPLNLLAIQRKHVHQSAKYFFIPAAQPLLSLLLLHVTGHTLILSEPFRLFIVSYQ